MTRCWLAWDDGRAHVREEGDVCEKIRPLPTLKVISRGACPPRRRVTETAPETGLGSCYSRATS